jgi:hypothetical protein
MQRLADDGATVMRGFSDAYGSWKMICMSRAQRAQLVLARRGDVLALEPDLARGGLDQAQDAAAGGALAAARFAHQPSVSPAAMSKLTPSTACTLSTTRGSSRP